nr:MAG TPA: hypothetical protein [Caudoviricetes sp.]
MHLCSHWFATPMQSCLSAKADILCFHIRSDYIFIFLQRAIFFFHH